MTTKPDDADSTPTSDLTPEVNLPGTSDLRKVVSTAAHHFATAGPSLRRDAAAGLTCAIANVPDGMANGLLVGVNPVYGLYAAMAGPLLGGILSSTSLMVITTTAAASLTTTQALGQLTDDVRAASLFAMVVLVGALQVLFGLLHAGRLVRFVSLSVMTGLLTGVSVLLVLSQFSTITSIPAEGANKVAQALGVVRNIAQVSLLSVAMAVLTLALAIILPRTRLEGFAALAAVVVPSVVVALLGLDDVPLVRSRGEITGLPSPTWPAFSVLSFDVITGALAVAVVILVQGAGVSQNVPNPDGSRSSASRDFIAEGFANVAAGFFRGLPVGGSLSATALNVVSGARTRWAAIFAGVWMAIIVIVIPGLVGYVAMPSLGAMLILAGARSVKPREIGSVLHAGWPSILACVTTFVLTLFLPIQVAVGVGVVLSALLYVNESSTDVSVVELVERPGGRVEERRPSKQLPSQQVTVLDIYGPLFFAGARTLERLLPTPRGSRSPVVVLRLRGRTHFGATFEEVLTRYAEQLREVGGKLYLTGLTREVHRQLDHSNKLHLSGPVEVYKATAILGESTRAAHADAQAWLVEYGRGDRTPRRSP
ncbi:MAG: SulP family inorganic anion transporter [Solirubrobacterales bacterium]